MQEIKKFCHERFGEIRTLADERGEPLFVGKDVATALGYKNPQKALRDHVDEEDKLGERIVLSGQHRGVIFINESGLYSLILSSKLEQARAFKRWVTAEVLPQIRRTGGYIPTRDAEGRQLSEEGIVARAQEILGRTLLAVNTPSLDCQTATEVARDWGMDVQSFNQLLCRMGIQSRKNGRWYLAEELEGRRLAETRMFLYYSLRGGLKLRTYLVWTREGVAYLNSRLLGSGERQPKAVQLRLTLSM